MTKPVWSHVLFLSAWTLRKAHIYSQLPGSLSQGEDYKYLCARQIPHQPSLAFQTIPDCINMLLVSFAITLNHSRTFLLHINTLACDIAHAQEFTLLIHCEESLRPNNIYILHL